MKALVAVKRVLDYNIKARIKSDQSGIDLENVKMSANPFDEIAVEEAVRLKEAGKVSEITVISVGTEASIETLRSALALGADKAILIKTTEDPEPIAIAAILKKIIETKSTDIVITGKQAIDNDCNQTAQMLAGILGWPQATFISKLEIDGKKITATRETDKGLETISCQVPCVLSTDLRLNTPRFPKLPNIMKARQKPLEIIPVEDLGISINPRHTIVKYSEPESRKAGVKVQDIAELVRRLHEEAKVI